MGTEIECGVTLMSNPDGCALAARTTYERVAGLTLPLHCRTVIPKLCRRSSVFDILCSGSSACKPLITRDTSAGRL